MQAIPNAPRNQCFIDILDLFDSDRAFFADSNAQSGTIINKLAGFINSLPSNVTPVIRYLVGFSQSSTNSPSNDTFVKALYDRTLVNFTNPNAVLYCGNFGPSFPDPAAGQLATTPHPEGIVNSIWQRLEEVLEKLWQWFTAEIKKVSAALYQELEKVEGEIIGWILRHVHFTVPLSWNHAKLFAVNGKHLVTGGANYWPIYSTGNQWLFDMSMSIVGDAAVDAQVFANYFWEYLALIPPWDQRSWCQSNLLVNPIDAFANATAPLYIDSPINTGNISALSVGRNGNWPLSPIGVPVQIFDAIRDLILNVVAVVVETHIYDFTPLIVYINKLLSDDNPAFRSILNEAGINPAAWASRYARNYAVSRAEQSIRFSQQSFVDPYALFSSEYVNLVNEINTVLKINWDGYIWPYDTFMALGSALSNISNNSAPAVTGVEIVTSTMSTANGGYYDLATAADFKAMLTDVMQGMLFLGYINPAGSIENTINKFLALKRIDNNNNGDHANHSKMVIVDDSVCYIGSDNAYPSYNEEFGLWIDDQPSIASFITDYWNGLWEFANPSTDTRKARVKPTQRNIRLEERHVPEPQKRYEQEMLNEKLELMRAEIIADGKFSQERDDSLLCKSRLLESGPCPDHRANLERVRKLLNLYNNVIDGGRPISRLRSHYVQGKSINLRAIAQPNGRYRVDISEPDGGNRFRRDCECQTLEKAQYIGDGLVQEAYPHECTKSGCEDWKDFAN
ncbi:MAG: hypothetical protein V7641_366 [Blastocatellia bacterium]